MTLKNSGESLINTLEGKAVSIRPHLLPGIPRTSVQAALNSLGLVPPNELYELYEWHNGVDIVNAPCLLFGEHQFLTLADAIREHQELTHYYGQITSSLNIDQCFPIAGFEGSMLAVYCEPVPVQGLQNPVIEIYHGISAAFESIDTMMKTVEEWFSSGIYDTEPVDDDRRFAIRQRFNPRLPYRSYSL